VSRSAGAGNKSSRATEEKCQSIIILLQGKNTYRLVLAHLEHVLGEILDSPRVSDRAVVALVLDGWTTFAQTAGNESIGLRIERRLVPFSHDDLLLQVFEAVGRVLVWLLEDLALAARNARRMSEKSLQMDQ
jgi:hypothetical protein